MLVDSHCHLDLLEAQSDFSVEQIVESSIKSSVTSLLNISTSIKNFATSISYASRFNNIFTSIGIHPLYISEGLISFEDLSRWLFKHKKVVAIGETGFDFYRVGHTESDKKQQYKLQAENLDIHIAAAQEYDLPIIIHTRAADNETIDFISSRYKSKPFRGVIHCFSSSKQLAYKMLDIGFYISASGIVTFKNASDIRDTIFDVPQDRLLVETDAPYLAPMPMRGKLNYPEYVVHTAKYLASMRGEDFENFCATTTNNFFKLFNNATQC